MIKTRPIIFSGKVLIISKYRSSSLIDNWIGRYCTSTKTRRLFAFYMDIITPKKTTYNNGNVYTEYFSSRKTRYD